VTLLLQTIPAVCGCGRLWGKGKVQALNAECILVLVALLIETMMPCGAYVELTSDDHTAGGIDVLGIDNSKVVAV
jgi:hypothetical protein